MLEIFHCLRDMPMAMTNITSCFYYALYKARLPPPTLPRAKVTGDYALFHDYLYAPPVTASMPIAVPLSVTLLVSQAAEHSSRQSRDFRYY